MQIGVRNWTPDAITLTATASNFQRSGGPDLHDPRFVGRLGNDRRLGRYRRLLPGDRGLLPVLADGNPPGRSAPGHGLRRDAVLQRVHAYRGAARGGEFPGRPDQQPLLSLHREPPPQRRHGRLCGRGVLPRQQRHAGADGGLPPRNALGSRFPPPPATGTVCQTFHLDPLRAWIEELSRRASPAAAAERPVLSRGPCRLSRRDGPVFS